ncbi:MAG: sigma-54-dependent Fis family transcriptional regulator [Deltaproteobacteria bacterium]|nr:sigma-54-dependent Fis family transcriptional regulator [Deltaproteobacteria bacterium]MBW2016369.1 sigma-54-dependent Fis family transcriptional regulator [Deltaproteobacteria bacterium]MBW2130767.1 sigma-54-dependent Fis family transcriptional regulator [Deltaproteobacteria bacterium]MBW2304143.1 sigma-54-dependent Fis family transcriptional regulator [Deltaproteobacteria bacterium]
MKNRILVIDDEPDFLESVRRGLVTKGFRNIQTETDPVKVASLFRRGESADVVLIDITMPVMSGVELLEVIKGHSPGTECIMVTAVNDAPIAVECMKKGAYDYLVKPVSRDKLVVTIHRALERKRLLHILDLEKKKTAPRLDHPGAFRPIVTRSPKMLRVLKEAELHAASDVPVLITGESGTGKELLARAVHAASPRSKFPFLAVNMASLTGTLFDAEFFGHSRGAFTGAEKDRAGYLQHANRGTLFLDEIGTLAPDLQGKLLRVLQEGEYIKLGTDIPKKIDIRFVAATNADLEVLMAKGRFRKDLYYRLKGAWLHLPPLRERREDIPLLIERFLKESGVPSVVSRIDEEAMDLLLNYSYPGNIRELRSIIESAVNLSRGGTITASTLHPDLRRHGRERRQGVKEASRVLRPLSEVEKEHILAVYKYTGRNKSRTARLLGIGLNTLRRKLAAYGEY